MQNFLPYADFAKSVQTLDRQRLVKQPTETKQCINALQRTSGGWVNHPAVLAWKNCIWSLCQYGIAASQECLRHGYQANSLEFFAAMAAAQSNHNLPDWFGREDIHSSHRGRLLCKGAADAVCAAIKSRFKIKKIDDWLEVRLGKTKNQLKYKDVLGLQEFCSTQNIEVGPNFYAKFGWTESPEMEYVWN